jgi:hypothetical protein
MSGLPLRAYSPRRMVKPTLRMLPLSSHRSFPRNRRYHSQHLSGLQPIGLVCQLSTGWRGDQHPAPRLGSACG